MTVAHDAATESVRTATTDPYSFNHTGRATGSGGVQGVAVFVLNLTTATDQVTGVTYGGVALTEIAQAVDTAGEPSNSQLFFVGSGLTGGTQAVEVDFGSATGDDFLIVVVTMTAGGNVQVIDALTVSNNVANPSVTLALQGRSCQVYGGIVSGLPNVGDPAPTTGITAVHDHDAGALVARVDRSTNVGTSDFAFGYTAASDDVSLVAAAFAEVIATGITRHDVGGTQSSTDGGTYTGPSGSLPANARVLAFVAPSDTGSSDPNSAGHRPLVNNTPWGLTWSERTEARISRDFGSGNITGLFVFEATTGGGGAGVDTFDVIEDGNNDSYTGCIIYVVAFTHSSGSVPTIEQIATDVETGAAQPLLNTLAALGAGAHVEASFVLDRQAPGGTPDFGWRQAYSDGHASPARGMWHIYSDGATTDDEPRGAWTNSDFIAVAVEIAPPATVLERSASIDATGGIAVSATGFSLLSRAAAVDAAGAIASIPQRAVLRSAAVGAVAAVASEPERDVLRSAAVAASAAIATVPQRDILRAGAVNAGAAIATDRELELERQVVVDGAAAIAVSAISFTLFDRAAALDAAAGIASVPERELLRAAAIAATAGIATVPERDLERQVAIDSTAAIAAAAVAFSVLSRAAALDASAAIATVPERELQRATSIAAAAAIASSAERDLLRAAALGATAGIASDATTSAVFQVQAVLAASASITAAHELEMQRQLALAAIAGVAIAARTLIPHRSVAVAASASISTSFERDLERAVQVGAAADIVAVVQLELERASSLEAVADILTAAVRIADTAGRPVVTTTGVGGGSRATEVAGELAGTEVSGGLRGGRSATEVAGGWGTTDVEED